MKRHVGLVLGLVCSVASAEAQRVPSSPWSFGGEFGVGGVQRENTVGPSITLSVGRDVAKHLTLRSALELLDPKPMNVDYSPCQPQPVPCDPATPNASGLATLSTGLELLQVRNDLGLYAGGGLAAHVVDAASSTAEIRTGWYWALGFAFPVGISAVTIEGRRHEFFARPAGRNSFAVIRLGVRIRTS